MQKESQTQFTLRVACNIVFQERRDYICPGYKGCLWGGQPSGFGRNVHEA